MLRVEPAEVGRASDEDVSLEILMDFCSDFRGFLANISQFFDMFLKFKVSKVFEGVLMSFQKFVRWSTEVLEVVWDAIKILEKVQYVLSMDLKRF